MQIAVHINSEDAVGAWLEFLLCKHVKKSVLGMFAGGQQAWVAVVCPCSLSVLSVAKNGSSY